MSVMVSSALRRYEFYAHSSDFLSKLKEALTQGVYTDPHWSVLFHPSGTALPDDTNKLQRWGYDNAWESVYYEALMLKNNHDPDLVIHLVTNRSKWRYNYSYYRYKNYLLRLGYQPNGDVISPDIYNNLGHQYEVPYHVSTTANDEQSYNVYYKFTVFTTKDFIFVYGDYQDHQGYAFPFRMYMGRCRPYVEEDSAIANDFIGIFPHIPIAFNSSNDLNRKYYNFGRGLVRKSRNGTPDVLYELITSTQVTSPGAGGKFYLSPFYVSNANEGVRGELWGMSSMVFKPGSEVPDGSVFDLDGNRYYVFHVTDQYPPYNHGMGWYTSRGTHMYSRPYFMDSSMRLSGGQRAILFNLTELERRSKE